MSHKARAEGQTKTGIINSPYVQLLEAKKKGQAYKYELIKNDKPVPVKKVSSSNPNKSYKSYSNERSKPSRKKRIYTEQADESISGTIHEFLQIGHSDNRHQASKSLFYDDLAPKQVETAKEH